MKIKFENLGYVKEVIIDMDKDITILCGPNNTGKTYVATALYGLMRFKFKLTEFSFLRTVIDQAINDVCSSINLRDLVVTNFDKIFIEFAKGYKSYLPNVFATDFTFFENTKITFLDLNIDEYLAMLEKQVLEHQIGFKRLNIQIFKDANSYTISWVVPTDSYQIPRRILQQILSDVISQILIGIVLPNAFIAPVERIAINLFSKELSLRRNEMVDNLLELRNGSKNKDPFDFINRRATRYPLPVRDGLQIAEDLANYKKKTTKFDPIAAEIENEILKGKIIISKEGEVQFQPNKALKKLKLKLSSHMSASAVKSLANLVIYFRYIASVNDFIIIDEPELNLHPDNQIIMARILALMVHGGFKLVISTHSDYIIKELNNLIMLKKHKNKLNELNKLEEFADYKANSLIDYKNVSALLFNYEKQTIEELEVNDTGFEVSTIDNVIRRLNKVSQELYFGMDDDSEMESDE